MAWRSLSPRATSAARRPATALASATAARLGPAADLREPLDGVPPRLRRLEEDAVGEGTPLGEAAGDAGTGAEPRREGNNTCMARAESA
mmetsp:Transcript_86513/g.269236  ORF Transcript_86513/g.269236 Transcript_86513/m.269236 type:complete len:89 (+) Transcript_86513:590-856(+)